MLTSFQLHDINVQLRLILKPPARSARQTARQPPETETSVLISISGSVSSKGMKSLLQNQPTSRSLS